MKIAGYDWDDGNRTKCQKHGVSLSEIEALFEASPHFAPDLKHSGDEIRYVAVGRGNGRPMFVAFTLRIKEGKHLIRPVSARYMHEKEAKNYEAQSS